MIADNFGRVFPLLLSLLTICNPSHGNRGHEKPGKLIAFMCVKGGLWLQSGLLSKHLSISLQSVPGGLSHITVKIDTVDLPRTAQLKPERSDSTSSKCGDSRGKEPGIKSATARKDSLMLHPKSMRHSRYHSWHDFSAFERDRRHSVEEKEKIGQWKAENLQSEVRGPLPSPTKGSYPDNHDM